MKHRAHPNRQRPDNAVLAKRKRARKRIERATNPDVQFAREREADRQRIISYTKRDAVKEAHRARMQRG